MKSIHAILALVFAFSGVAEAAIHTVDKGVRAVQRNQVKTDILVYKVKDRIFEMNQQNWQPFLSRQVFKTAPLFRKMARVRGANSEFGRYYVRHYPQALSVDAAIQILHEMFFDTNIEFAYFEPKVSDAVMIERMSQAQVPALQNAPGDFQAQQFYLEAAPVGIDAQYAWSLPGGTGKGIRVIDVETGWQANHFEFAPVFFDNGKNAVADHGTAVWGEIAARPDGFGVTGIAYDVEYGIAGNGMGTGGFTDYPNTIASVIEGAVAQMQAGDVLVIEQHAPLVDDYGPIEYFEPVFKILKAATDSGIHCVAAAGNGYSNLDDPKYSGAFDMNVRDSGCILVGAADSPRGTRARQRSDFSDYGSRVDAFAYGEDVVTTGYGDLFDGSYQGRPANYTATFSGTSSATPIVAGTVIGILGIAKAKGVSLTPAQVRTALRATGTAQEGAEKLSQRIGNLPNAPELVEYLNIK